MKLYIDCHGVLTDSSLYIDMNGKTHLERFNLRDKDAIRSLILKGWEVVIYTQSDSHTIRQFASLCGAKVQVSHDKPQPEGIYYAIGDTETDKQLLEGALNAFCPADSVVRVKHINVLKTKGGEGCIMELCKYL